MKIFNFGSINIDLVYAVPHLPQPGETLHSTDHNRGLGGKGANMSIAIAASGAEVFHIGAIGQDGEWTRSILSDRSVNVDSAETLDVPTGHAVIQVDAAGENVITLYPGANSAMPEKFMQHAHKKAVPGDWLLLQNETSHVVAAAKHAKDMGLRVAYAAAPFDADATQAVLPYLDLIALNAVEAVQLGLLH